MPDSLQIALKNSSDSDQVYAYITGIALQHGGQRCVLKADGHGLYFPENPPAIGSPLTEDCAIPLGAPGNTVTVTIPQMAGGRIWFSRNAKLTFLLNPGPALVEPSVLNPSDPNANVDFGFCEFTLNDAQLYANISYVDFVPRLPIAISLKQASGEIQSVAGMAPDGVDRLANALRGQAGKDSQPWDKLVVERDGEVLRILNATHGNAVGASFDGYFEAYVDLVWEHFLAKQERGEVLKINTQAAPGILEAQFTRDSGVRIGDEMFSQPTTADILGCNSGPFTTGPSPTRNAVIPRLAAAFVRSALLVADEHPSQPHTFYRTDPTNHYARLVHEHNVDGKGYAFAYDDVQPDGGDDQSGKVNAGDPVLFTVTIGGAEAPSH
ncbi:glycoside hydrolase family 64 protein [Annulohypoxylon stygium]|nr:glycoside hydrolase family 64 protein [Annulohypoxylon stygium]